MLSRVNSMVWMEEAGKGSEDHQQGSSNWGQTNSNGGGLMEGKEDMEIGALNTFKSMLEAEGEDWYMANPAGPDQEISFSPGFDPAAVEANHHQQQQQLQQQQHHGLLVDSSASCSPTSGSVFTNLEGFNHHHQVSYSLQPKANLLNQIPNCSFDLGGCDGTNISNGYLESALLSGGGGGFHDLGPHSNQIMSNHFTGSSSSSLVHQGGLIGGLGFGEGSLVGNGNSLFFNNRSKILKPLDNFTSVGSQPTLFQKRAALRKNLGNNSHLGALNIGNHTLTSHTNEGGINIDKKAKTGDENERKRKSSSGDDVEDVSIDGSNLNYDSDDQFLEFNNKAEESGKNGQASASGDPKGKKKGPPAKNLMAERRRRQKLNDRLLMLRSVVPKISKMDRASILGDAIDYLKELLQKINDLHNELESIPSSSSMTHSANFYPLTPTTPGLPARIKEELCPSAFASPLSSPTAGQPARVEVRIREGRAVNIHMFCGRKPGLLLSTLKAMDNLGLDVQQAVISCFNGFALDVFRAEQCGDGQELNPDQIKAVLLNSAGFHGMV